jgi:osmoprotectant transport system substrate-binding protein
MRIFRRPAFGAVLLALALVSGACRPGGGGTTTGGEAKGTVKVGVSGAFTENEIVAEMYALILENAGYKVERQLNLETREISQPAIQEGEIDLKPEYVGSLLLFLDPKAPASSDGGENADQLRNLLPDGLELLALSEVNNVNAFVVTKDFAEKNNLSKISDLKPLAANLILGAPGECAERPLCIPGLRDKYGITFKQHKALREAAQRVTELKVGSAQGGVDVALLFSTDGPISKEGFVILEDDQELQPAENIAPLIRTKVLNEEIESLLNGLSAKLTTKKMSELNAKVDIDNEDPEEVAKDFLVEEDLLT